MYGFKCTNVESHSPCSYLWLRLGAHGPQKGRSWPPFLFHRLYPFNKQYCFGTIWSNVLCLCNLQFASIIYILICLKLIPARGRAILQSINWALFVFLYSGLLSENEDCLSKQDQLGFSGWSLCQTVKTQILGALPTCQEQRFSCLLLAPHSILCPAKVLTDNWQVLLRAYSSQ